MEIFGSVWETLEGVLGDLGGVLEASISQDGAKMPQEPPESEIPRALPSGLSPPGRVWEALENVWEVYEGVLEAVWAILGVS